MTFLKRWKISILLFFAVLGPGFITANVDNDAGGILTYSQAGAQFGYSLLWTMIPITLALIVVQEMCARMGVVTGKGLSRPDPRRIWTAHHVHHDGAAGGRELRQRGHRVHRHCGQPAALPREQIYLGAGVRAAGVAAGGEGQLQEHREDFSASHRLSISPTFLRACLSQPSWHDAIVSTVKLPPKSVWHDRTYIYMAIG